MKRSTRIVWLAVSGLLAGTLSAVWWAREPTEPLTEANLAAARRRWQAAGLGDYQLGWRVGNERYEGVVRRGVVTAMKHLGENADTPPAGASDAQSYSVEGWFDTLDRDLELRSEPGGQLSGALLRVRFNRRCGYLERYVRSIPATGRTQVIQIERFVPAARDE